MNPYDAHCHLSEESTQTIEEYLLKYKYVCIGGYNPLEWEKQKKVQLQYGRQVISSYGLHPWYISDYPEEKLNQDLKALEESIKNIHFIGEIGLDFSKKRKETSIKQEKYFIKQLSISREMNKKNILHIVKSENRALSIIKEVYPDIHGMIHSFHGNKQQLQDFLKLNLFFSIGPNVLKKRSSAFEEALFYLPIDRLLVESDFPGQTADMNSLNEIIKELALIKKQPQELILEAANDNFKKFFQ